MIHLSSLGASSPRTSPTSRRNSPSIMKKLNTTNRTQAAYLTRGFFEGTDRYQT
jgi:hypothetical protein